MLKLNKIINNKQDSDGHHFLLSPTHKITAFYRTFVGGMNYGNST